VNRAKDTQLKCFILDDSVADLNLYKKAISIINEKQKNSFILDVSWGSSKEDLMHSVKSGAFHFYILDLILVNSKCFDLIRKLRKNKHSSKAPIIVLSNSDFEEDMEEAYDSGATDYSTKPYKFSALVRLLERIIRTYCLSADK